jgi:hypothetical protein
MRVAAKIHYRGRDRELLLLANGVHLVDEGGNWTGA